MMLRVLSACAAMMLAALPAFAQSGSSSMPGMQMAAPAANAPASTKAYQDAMAKMDKGMSITYSGNADKDFVAGMIPHHQGAIDMAQVELRYGKDPQLRKLAHDIVAAQQKEIAFMQGWQAKHAQ